MHLRFFKNRRSRDQDFLVKMGGVIIHSRVADIRGTVFYLQCMDLVATRLCTQQVINFFLTPKTCNNVLKSSKHKTVFSCYELIFVFILCFINEKWNLEKMSKVEEGLP